MNHTIVTQGLTVDDLLASVREIVRDEIQAIPKPEKVKPYMSLEDVCEFTGMAKQTVYNLTSEKKIPHVKRYGRLLFNREEIIKWLEEAAQPVED